MGHASTPEKLLVLYDLTRAIESREFRQMSATYLSLATSFARGDFPPSRLLRATSTFELVFLRFLGIQIYLWAFYMFTRDEFLDYVTPCKSDEFLACTFRQVCRISWLHRRFHNPAPGAGLQARMQSLQSCRGRVKSLTPVRRPRTREYRTRPPYRLLPSACVRAVRTDH